MRILTLFQTALASILILPAVAMAQPFNGFVYRPLTPGTYAARALCPTKDHADLIVYLNDGGTVIGEAHDFCTNGRIGVTFTVPTAQTIIVSATFASAAPVINRDCREDVNTTCTFRVTGSYPNVLGTAAGRFTYPGDKDWIKIPVDYYLDDIRIKAPPGCFATGKVIHVENSGDYLEVIGGPSACTYAVIGRTRPWFK